jgi:hypothetical protein
MIKSILKKLLFGLIVVFNPAVGQNLTLSCSGVETSTLMQYSEGGKFQSAEDTKKQIKYTLIIENSRHESYPCRFNDNEIVCNDCVQNPKNCTSLFNDTRVDRYTGQTTVNRFMRTNRVGYMKSFEGVCTKVEKRKF